VEETYNALSKHDIFIVGEVVLPIQHCLVVRQGVDLSQVRCVMSHEQVSEALASYFALIDVRHWVNADAS
jgi:prephenate dehydratase